MKAVQIHGHGGSDALVYADADNPQITAGDVLIRVAAIGVNPADHKHRSGMFKDFVPYSFPYVGGYDVAGTIEAVGSEVTGFRPGDRVFSLLDPMKAGGYAELAATTAAGCAIMPDNLDFETAAAIPCSGLTGVQLVEDALHTRAGDTVVITGATGMVGRFALHAAKAAGAFVVAAVRDSYAELAHQMGADAVIVLGTETWSGKPFDGAIDTVGGSIATFVVAQVKADGKIITTATDPLDVSRLSSQPLFVAVHPDGARLRRLGAAVARGEIAVPITARYPLAEAAQAQRVIEAGGNQGKIILLPNL